MTDKLKHLQNQASGKAKELEGKLTGDKLREMQGQAQEALGKAQDQVADWRDELKDRVAAHQQDSDSAD